jgi:hypothetical protein
MRVYLHANHISGSCRTALTRLGIDHVAGGPTARATLPVGTDAAILEVRGDDSAAGYLLALAVSQQLPTLCLVERGTSLPEPLAAIRSDARCNRLVRLVHYAPERVGQVVERFVTEALGRGYERASIKFTFRLTPSLDRYLGWRAKLVKLDKASFLRRFLSEEVTARDEAYREHLAKVRRDLERGDSASERDSVGGEPSPQSHCEEPLTSSRSEG